MERERESERERASEIEAGTGTGTGTETGTETETELEALDRKAGDWSLKARSRNCKGRMRPQRIIRLTIGHSKLGQVTTRKPWGDEV